ncbi:MAG TPA: hypothetical protein VLF93_03170 [Candidatus Saccharimonadales bacterium]|nr:hypothetical protein [Candidatus Saccharimonadales bacterium]
MTLHDTTEFSKKAGIVLGLLLGLVIIVTVFLKVGAVIHAILFPPKIAAPNEAYGKLPPYNFPQSSVTEQFTYTINTVSGALPDDFPDRLYVYPMIISQPDVLNLQNAKQNVSNLQFVNGQGDPLPAIPLGGPEYEWRETTPGLTGFQRTIDYNVVNQNFTMNSNYLTQLSVLQAQYIQNMNDPTAAIQTVQTFLSSFNGFPSDVDLALTQNPPDGDSYTTAPQLYAVVNGQLQPTTALANAQVVRVDLYQKEIDYTLTAGIGQDLTHSKDFDMTLPIIYPHPPYSTMHFLVASGQNEAEIASAIYQHQTINLQPENVATYPIKSPQQAFDELKSGKAYIASYNGTESQILINKVFLAYYMGATQQNYLMPVVIFQGQDGFFAYVPAILDNSGSSSQ